MSATFAAELKREIIEPTCQGLGLGSPEAVDLVLGTAIAESGLKRLRQISGPALGLWQMEPATHADIWANYLSYRPHLIERLQEVSGIGAQDLNALIFNLRYACAMCRIHYKRVADPIPETLEAQAAYYKRYFNTELGKGSARHYLQEWEAIHA